MTVMMDIKRSLCSTSGRSSSRPPQALRQRGPAVCVLAQKRQRVSPPAATVNAAVATAHAPASLQNHIVPNGMYPGVLELASQGAAVLAPATDHIHVAVPWQRDGFYDGAYRCYLEVRPDEVDQYGVVSHTNFSSFLLMARSKVLEAIGASLEAHQERSMMGATVKLDIAFKGPLRPGDRFYVSSAVGKVEAARAVFEEAIVRLPKEAGEAPHVVAEAHATCLFVSPEYRPMRIPAETRTKMQAAAAAYIASKALENA